MASKGDYFGLGRLVSIILAIIPITAWICGIITRIQEGKIVAAIVRVFLGGWIAIVRVFLGGWIVWVIDLVLMILSGRILRIIPL